jgi:hypothetical protein
MRRIELVRRHDSATRVSGSQTGSILPFRARPGGEFRFLLHDVRGTGIASGVPVAVRRESRRGNGLEFEPIG